MRFHRLSAFLPATLGACSVLASLCVLPQLLLAATITVDGQTGDPPGTCDLVEAIENAKFDLDANSDCTGVGIYGADTIVLTEDVVLDAPSDTDLGFRPSGVRVDSEIEIQGNGYAIRRAAAALDDFRVLLVVLPGDLTLRNTTVSGGIVDGLDGGGAILNGAGRITLVHSTLSGNSAFPAGGAIRNSSGGTVEIINSTLAGNTATLFGGAIDNLGTLVVTRSTLSGNTTTAGDGGAISNRWTATVTDSTLSGNSASGDGSAISSSPLNNSLALVLANSTLAGNTGAGNGALSVSAGTATLSGSILANTAGGSNCAGTVTITNAGGNLADDGTCGTIADTLTGLDPVLSDNGGPTMTHALLPGSHAIGFAPTCPPTDQRGAAREADCDSGAFEFLTCPDLSFTGETVSGSRTVWNCQNLAADFAVGGTGELTLRAGRSIEIHDDTTVASGGELTLVIDGGLQVAKIAFATSSSHSGDLVTEANTLTSNTGCGGGACTDGLEAGDAICQHHADSNPGDPLFTGRVFKAWLSDAACSPAQGCRSFTQSMAQYYRVDGVRIADDWADLTDGSLQVPINLDEQGNGAELFAWTNTLPDGNRSSDTSHCSGWTDGTDAQQGVYGFTPITSSLWTDAEGETPCDASLAVLSLYCFEQ